MSSRVEKWTFASLPLQRIRVRTARSSVRHQLPDATWSELFLSCPTAEVQCSGLAPTWCLSRWAVLRWLRFLYVKQLGQCQLAARELQWHLSVVTAQGKAGRWPQLPLRLSLPLVGKVIHHQISSGDMQVKEQVGISSDVLQCLAPKGPVFFTSAAVSECIHCGSSREILRVDEGLEGNHSLSSVGNF